MIGILELATQNLYSQSNIYPTDEQMEDRIWQTSYA
jgi:hypothetical protein